MNLPQFLTGGVGFVILVLAALLCVYWLLFPWLVVRRLDRIARGVVALEKAAADQSLVQRNFFSDVREVMKEKQPPTPL